jgi:RNA polymerase sigma-70 factor (ECF subfamily)
MEGEDQIIKKAQKGDTESFSHLYNQYLPKIYRFVLFKVNSRQAAEDLSHDVFLSAWQSLDSYRPQGFPFSSWLYQIARNKVIDHYRTFKGHSSLENIDENLLKIVGVAEHSLDQTLNWERVCQATKQLSEDQQDALIMRFVEDLSYPEIAAALDKSEGAVRLLQHRAVSNLKNILNPNGGNNN